MEPTDEFAPTSAENIQNDLARIQLTLRDIHNNVNEIQNRTSPEELITYIKNMENSILNLSNEFQSLGEDNRREINRIFDEIRRKLDTNDYNSVNFHKIIQENLNKNFKSIEGRFVYVFRNIILLLIFFLLFYIAAK
jgi:hypothetical protein